MARERWRLVAAVAVQLAVLALVPARQLLAGMHGTEVTLATAPVDPFDTFSGPFVALAYEVEQPCLAVDVDATVFVTVQRGEPAWTFVSLDRERPPASDGRVSLRATCRPGRASLDSAGRFYLPQEQATDVERMLRPNGGPRMSALVDVLVDGAGNVALRRLRVGGRTFGQ